MKIINPKKLDKMFEVERPKEEPKEEITKEITVANKQAKKDLAEIRSTSKDLLLALQDDEKLEEYIFDKVSNNTETAETILEKLVVQLESGVIDPKMFESAASLVKSIALLLEQVNKVKSQKEKFRIEKAKIVIDVEKVRQDEGRDKSNKTLVITREALLKEILERNL